MNRCKKVTLTLPEMALIVGTRAMLGAGVGLLLAGKLSDEKRKAIGATLVFVGAITTIPLVFELLGSRE